MSRAVRRPRARATRGASAVGRWLTVDVGPWAHGGHCVARVPTSSSVEPVETRVVFVRHALPGERVVVEVTEGGEGDRFWRADAVSVLTASPDRVVAPCRYAHPGGCGGCDLQHVAVPAQRSLKADVVREQLRRLGGLSGPLVDGLVVEPVPGDEPPGSGLHWRTRMQYVDLGAGRRGLRRHRSHDVVEVDECLIAAPGALRPSPDVVHETVAGASFAVAADGFWQVHPGAPAVLVDCVLTLLRPRPGDGVLDLYAGVGLFARFLGEAVGPTGSVVAVEGSAPAADHARDNLADLPWVSVVTGRVDATLPSYDAADLVVLDPPREGARRPVVEGVVATGARAVAYVACDPAALARDLAVFADLGYHLTALRAFDLFPMTHHVECVALLEPA